jgi:hypothetical protein
MVTCSYLSFLVVCEFKQWVHLDLFGRCLRIAPDNAANRRYTSNCFRAPDCARSAVFGCSPGMEYATLALLVVVVVGLELQLRPQSEAFEVRRQM